MLIKTSGGDFGRESKDIEKVVKYQNTRNTMITKMKS